MPFSARSLSNAASIRTQLSVIEGGAIAKLGLTYLQYLQFHLGIKNDDGRFNLSMLNGVYPATFTYLALLGSNSPIQSRRRVTVQSFIRLKTSVFVLASSRVTALKMLAGSSM